MHYDIGLQQLVKYCGLVSHMGYIAYICIHIYTRVTTQCHSMERTAKRSHVLRYSESMPDSKMIHEPWKVQVTCSVDGSVQVWVRTGLQALRASSVPPAPSPSQRSTSPGLWQL